MTVTGGQYGVLAAAGASGLSDFENVDISGTSSAGVYYVKDLRGELSGSISGSSGAGIKFGSATSNDLTWNGLTLGTNAIGVETAGKGTLTFIDSNFGNTKDAVISGTATIDFVEGDVDATTVQVTGSGVFNRMRQLDITLTADSNPVVGPNVILKKGDGEATGSAITDSNGDAADMTFKTQTVDLSGFSQLNLAGYEAVTVAKVGSY